MFVQLTHWGRVTYICVSKLTITGSDNGLSPGRRQAIIWTNDGLLLIGPLGTNFSEIWIEIDTFSSRKMFLKMSSGKWRPFCLGLNVLTSTLQRFRNSWAPNRQQAIIWISNGIFYCIYAALDLPDGFINHQKTIYLYTHDVQKKHTFLITASLVKADTIYLQTHDIQKEAYIFYCL